MDIHFVQKVITLGHLPVLHNCSWGSKSHEKRPLPWCSMHMLFFCMRVSSVTYLNRAISFGSWIRHLQTDTGSACLLPALLVFPEDLHESNWCLLALAHRACSPRAGMSFACPPDPPTDSVVAPWWHWCDGTALTLISQPLGTGPVWAILLCRNWPSENDHFLGWDQIDVNRPRMFSFQHPRSKAGHKPWPWSWDRAPTGTRKAWEPLSP